MGLLSEGSGRRTRSDGRADAFGAAVFCSQGFIFTNFLWNLYAPFIWGSVSSICERNSSKTQCSHLGASCSFRMLRQFGCFSCAWLCIYNRLATKRGGPSVPAWRRHYSSYHWNPTADRGRTLPGFNGQEKQEIRAGAAAAFGKLHKQSGSRKPPSDGVNRT
jgi:hypothetical protein